MFCPQCGNQAAPDARFCSSCGAAVTAQHVASRGRIVRPRSPRMIAGVCSGVAIHYGWDIALVRILLVVFTFLTGGLGILLYIAAWVILPDALYALPSVTYPYYPPPSQATHGPTV